METLRSFHALNSYLVSSSITPAYYNINDAGTTDGSQYKLANLTTDSYQNAFGLSVEFESFALRNDVILSGANTLSTQVFFETNINPDQSVSTLASYTLDFFAYFDQIVVLSNSILSVKF